MRGSRATRVRGFPAVAAAALVLVAGCGEEDKAAPPKPPGDPAARALASQAQDLRRALKRDGCTEQERAEATEFAERANKPRPASDAAARRDQQELGRELRGLKRAAEECDEEVAGADGGAASGTGGGATGAPSGQPPTGGQAPPSGGGGTGGTGGSGGTGTGGVPSQPGGGGGGGQGGTGDPCPPNAPPEC